jgi:hypothetical protein
VHLQSGSGEQQRSDLPVDFLADFPWEMVSKNKRHNTSWLKRLAREIFAALCLLELRD